MNTAQAKMLKKAIRKLVRAEIADSHKGGGYPEDYEIIAEELAIARAQVTGLIEKDTVQDTKYVQPQVMPGDRA